MTNDWESKEENLALIPKTIGYISNGLDELNEAICYPNSFISSLIMPVIDRSKEILGKNEFKLMMPR